MPLLRTLHAWPLHAWPLHAWPVQKGLADKARAAGWRDWLAMSVPTFLDARHFVQ